MLLTRNCMTGASLGRHIVRISLFDPGRYMWINPPFQSWTKLIQLRQLHFYFYYLSR